MYRPDFEAARGMAYMHAREQGMAHADAWRWANDHWMEFLDSTDTDPTGRMLIEGYRQVNRFK
jgi:hypothetical protein